MDGTVLAPGVIPRPTAWPDAAEGSIEQHSLDWKAVLKGATIASVEWDSTPSGLTFSASAISGAKTLITITAAALTVSRTYSVHARITDSNGNKHETNPPIRLKVQPGGDF